MIFRDIVTIIELKSRGVALSPDDIHHFVECVHKNEIDESQIGAFLMAVKLKGMNSQETACLTTAMAESSYNFNWSKYAWKDKVVDKHSTSGVGDKISHILAPILAACGLKMPMVSGRGLGITGGTIDKLESIKGFVPLDNYESLPKILESVGFFITGHTHSMVPVDKHFYAIRDVTATINSIPLITASILSKKKIEDAQVLLMDIKFGKGTHMKTESEANELAKSMRETAKALNLDLICFIDDMNSPLGHCVGNALEIAEVLKALNGDMSSDIKEIIHKMATYLIKYIDNHLSDEEINEKIKQAISSGNALKKFKEMLVHQGVSHELAEKLCVRKTLSVDDYLAILNDSSVHVTDLHAKNEGFVQSIDAEIVGTVCQHIGGGRKRKNDKIDYRVGIQLLAKEGDHVKKDEIWAKVYHSKELKEVEKQHLQAAIQIGNKKPFNLDRIKSILKPE